MNMQWFSKYEGEVKTLKLKRNPLYYGLGYYEDLDGNLWDVNTVIGETYSPNGRPYVCARPVDNSPYYSTASDGSSQGFHQWIPYYFEVHEKETQKH